MEQVLGEAVNPFSSLGKGELRFGGAPSTLCSWGTLHALSLITMVPVTPPQSCVGVMDGASPGPSPHTGGVGGGGVPWDMAQTTFWWVGSSLKFLLCPTTLLPWGHLKRWVEQDPLPTSPMSSTGGQTTPLFVFLALAVPLQLFL